MVAVAGNNRADLHEGIGRCDRLANLFEARINIHKAEMLGLQEAINQIEAEKADLQSRLAAVIDAEKERG